MTPERWRQIDHLLKEALEREPADQAAFLAEACGDDEELHRELVSLLGFQPQAGKFIEAPPAEVAADWLAGKESRTGQTIGHYQLIRQIGRGGMGEVYLARDARLGRQVALKLLPLRFTADAQRVQRFRQEARAASALNHPNIITIHEIGEATTEAGSIHFIATEFIEGRTLRELMKGGGMKLGEALEAAIQITGALSAAHATGITHRDIKPENIMLRPDGYVKVLDFGLAKLNEVRDAECEMQRGGEDASSSQQSVIHNPRPRTNPGVVLGTVSYMSPEQVRGLETDARSDLFSLGIVLYEMVTSHHPFGAETVADMIASLLGQAPPLAQHAPDLPSELRDVLLRLLAKDRAERFQTADELRRALKKLQQRLFPPEDFVTREFSGRALLTRRFGEAKEGKTYETTINASEAQTIATGAQPFFTRLIGSSRRIVLALAALGALIACVIWVAQWQRPRVTPVDSIAVLPFKPLVAGGRDEALEMGIADTLITRLSNLKRITVRPTAAVRRYAALDQDAVTAGRELGVQAVLEGSIQKVGEKVRVTARLISVQPVAEGKPLWTGRFDEQWTDIFAVQDAIAQHVADDLLKTLSPGERGELARNYTADPEAYRFYLNGTYLWDERSPASISQSIASFQKATQKDPAYALAYVGLADAYVTLNTYHLTQPQSVLPQARKAAAQALKIDDNLAEAHAAMGKINNDYYWEWAEAEREFRRAIELKPNYPTAHHWYSTFLANMGRHDEALREAHRALELDPLSPLINTQVGIVLYWARRYDQAVAVLQQTLGREPDFIAARVYLGLCRLMQGQHDAALNEFRQARKLAPNFPDLVALLGYGCGLAGKRDEARRYQQELNELAKHTYVSPFNQAGVHAALGETDEAFNWMERCYAERDSFLGGMRTDPLYDSIRQDPRFADLERRIGLLQ